MYILSFGGEDEFNQHLLEYSISLKKFKNIKNNKNIKFNKNYYFIYGGSRSQLLFNDYIIIISHEPNVLLIYSLYKYKFIKKYKN